MVTQLGRSNNIKSALKAKIGITAEGIHNHGPMICRTLNTGERQLSGLNQGIPYSNRNRDPTSINNLTSSRQPQQHNISPPQRPATEHQYQYSSRSDKMEKVY